MGKKTTKTESKETATTQPNVPSYAAGPIGNYYQEVNDFQKLDPYSMWTPANDIQNRAFDMAGNLSQGGRAYDAAAGVFGNVMNGSTPQAGYGTAGMGELPGAQHAGLGQLGNAAQSGDAGLGERANNAAEVSLLDGFERYQNPATNAVVDTTLRGFDENAGRVRAAQQAAGARGGAFGGSRFGIAQAETERGLSQDRAATEAGLRSQAFDQSASLALGDAGLRQQTSLTNASAQNMRDTDRAGMRNANNQFNAGATNQFGMARFGAENDANQFNANNNNQFSLAGFEAANRNREFNAGAYNQNQQFNAGQELATRQQRVGAATGMVDAAGRYNTQERANLGAMLDAGGQKRGIDNAYAQMPLANLLQQQGLMSPELLRILTGQTINSTGTNKTTQSGGLLGTLAGIASLGSAFIPGIGGLFGGGGGSNNHAGSARI